MKKVNKQLLTSEDVRWLRLIQDTLTGLRAQAEIKAEACDTDWLAMLYTLEGLNETVESCIDDYVERLGMSKNKIYNDYVKRLDKAENKDKS